MGVGGRLRRGNDTGEGLRSASVGPRMHRERSHGRRAAICLPAAVGVPLVLAACTSIPAIGGNQPAQGNCTPVVVAASSEKVNMIEELGALFKSSPEASDLPACVSVKAINVPSGTAATVLSGRPSQWPLRDAATWPTVWSPASTIWTDRVVAAGAGEYVPGATSFARTPVVLGMPETMATALGYPGKAISLVQVEKLIRAKDGWGSVGKPLWGPFKVAKTNPNTSTTGLAMILMQTYAASGKSAGLTTADVASSADFSRSFELGAIHYGDTTGNVLSTLYGSSSGGGSTYVSALALEETSLFNYNQGNPDSHVVQPGEKLTPPAEKLVAVYPAEGSLWSDNPAVVLRAPWVSSDQVTAGQAFLTFLATPAAQAVLPKYGFRPLDQKADVSAHLNGAVGIDPTKPQVTLPKPDAHVVSAAIDTWTRIRKPSAVLEIIDISGSMLDPGGDGQTKLEGAIRGATDTLVHFRSSDEIGVWAFTTGVSSPLGPNLVPVRAFAPLGGDREALKGDIEALRHAHKAGTPLYDAVSRSYDTMLKQAEQGRINAIIVLSDGADTDSRTTLKALVAKISATAKEGGVAAPVRVFTIAYGADANKDVLQRISSASGGQLFDSSDPAKIQEVFAAVVNNF